MRLFLKPILAGAIAMSTMTATLAPAAFADQPRYQRDHDRGHDRNDRRWDHDRRYDGRWDNRRHFYRGDRFDSRVRYTRVVDYRYYHLRPPRRGEYYVRTDSGDILLLAAATGLVLWALNN
ncbi:MAG TPA: RcnB family protein [Hyphomonadaceae bacterium]|nr:RcnB family protein [Hyphomonadaceae bacterium]